MNFRKWVIFSSDFHFCHLLDTRSCQFMNKSSDTGSGDGYELEDVLPSFEMHNHMFNRSINDLSVPTNQPPEYLENSDRDRSHADPYNTPSFLDPSSLLLNNLSKLKMIPLPITIQTVITSEPPQFNKKSERANPLRQFKPGETIHGYIVIENKSKVPIPFEMLLVSLEGEQTISVNEHSKLVSQFLKSYDLKACYHEGIINAGTTRDITRALQQDPTDGTLFGFSPSRVILPNMKHKKFFTFTIPTYLLDEVCPHQLPHHLSTPPSFGCDKRACGGNAANIEINSLLGYGRLDNYGSPLKTYDMAHEGQSVSFYLHVQIIGKNTDNVYTQFQFQSSKTIEENDILIIKDSKYYIRVDNSLEQPLYEELNYNQFPPKSTVEQIAYVQHLVEDELHTLLERKNLIDIGINDRYEQDIIVGRNVSSTKKSTQSKQLLIPVVSSSSLTSDENGYRQRLVTKFTKDLFSKIDGELKIDFFMEKEAQMKAITPKPLSVISQRNLKLNAPASGPGTLKAMNSSASLSSVSSFTAIKSQEVGEFELFFEFVPKKSNSALPSSISITPNLVAYTVQSHSAIPITFDNHYMYKDGVKRLKNLSNKFQLYKNQLLSTSKDIKVGINKQTLEIADSLSTLDVTTASIKKLFTPEIITIQWVQNVISGNYQCNLRVKIGIDEKSTHRPQNQLLGIVPSFQSCHLTRGYLLELEIGLKKGKPKDVIHLPIIID